MDWKALAFLKCYTSFESPSNAYNMFNVTKLNVETMLERIYNYDSGNGVRRHREPIKFLFLPKWAFWAARPVLKKLVMNYKLLLRVVI